MREYIHGSSFKLDGQRWPPLVNSAVMETLQDEQELAKPGRGRLGCRSEISASQGPLAVGMPRSESMASDLVIKRLEFILERLISESKAWKKPTLKARSWLLAAISHKEFGRPSRKPKSLES